MHRPADQGTGRIRFNEDGTVTIITGTLDYGQGHWTPFAQVLHQTLGVPFERIRLVQGDSDLLDRRRRHRWLEVADGLGAAIVEAAQLVIEKGRNIAAHMLEAAVADIEFSGCDGLGRFTIAGTDRGIGIMELAERIRTANNPPPDLPTSARCAARLRRGAAGLSEWLPYRRGGDRAGYRRRSRWCATCRSTTSA